jgi:hypothetical protein
VLDAAQSGFNIQRRSGVPFDAGKRSLPAM